MSEARVMSTSPSDANPSDPSPTPESALTIDDVAREVGMTVRNLREWRALGLLPAPVMRGRAGYYDRGVVERVRRVQHLHAEGFPLELIRRMFDAGEDVPTEAMRLAEALGAPFRDPEPPGVDPLELAARWGADDPEHLERAVELGLMRWGADGSLGFTSARVARVGEAMWRMGLSIEDTLEATSVVRELVDGVAAVFERVWVDHVWEPFVRDGCPEDRRASIEATLAEVPDRALDAVIGLFTVAMSERVQAGVTREVARILADLGEPDAT